MSSHRKERKNISWRKLPTCKLETNKHKCSLSRFSSAGREFVVRGCSVGGREMKTPGSSSLSDVCVRDEVGVLLTLSSRWL